MIKNVILGLCAIVISPLTFAGEMKSTSNLPDKMLFVGLGGSYSAVNLDNQKIYGKGVDNAYTGSFLDSSGSAAGYSNSFSDNENIFSPHIQIGYQQHFTDSANFGGVKFSYDYLHANAANNNMTIDQAGSNTNYAGIVTYFTGNYAVESVQTTTNHELILLAFIGQSFNNSQVYLGLGPSLFGMQSNIDHLVGYADYSGGTTNISGAPAYLSNSSWAWGGAAQFGVTYNLSSDFFMDFNYTYAATARNTIKYVSPYTNDANGANQIGTSYINPSQRLATQSFAVSINKAFSGF